MRLSLTTTPASAIKPNNAATHGTSGNNQDAEEKSQRNAAIIDRFFKPGFVNIVNKPVQAVLHVPLEPLKNFQNTAPGARLVLR